MIGDGDWIILKTDEHWWQWPYHVVSPTGRLVEICMFAWTARRALRKSKNRQTVAWWNAPVIHREPS